MNDGLLVRVLNALAQLSEELQTLLGRQSMGVKVLGNGDALDVFHHEVRTTLSRRPAVEYFGDGWVVHEGQRLPLGLEAGHRLLRIHARLDDDGNVPADWFDVLGELYFAHASFSDELKEPVGAN